MDHGSAGFATGQWHGYAEPQGGGKPQQPPAPDPSPGPSLPWQHFAPDGSQLYAGNAGQAPRANGFGGQDGHQASGQQPNPSLGRLSTAEVTAGHPLQHQHDWQHPPAPVPDDDPADDAPPPLPPPDDDAPPPLPDELPPPDAPPASSASAGIQQQQQPAYQPHPSLQYAVPPEQAEPAPPCPQQGGVDASAVAAWSAQQVNSQYQEHGPADYQHAGQQALYQQHFDPSWYQQHQYGAQQQPGFQHPSTAEAWAHQQQQQYAAMHAGYGQPGLAAGWQDPGQQPQAMQHVPWGGGQAGYPSQTSGDVGMAAFQAQQAWQQQQHAQQQMMHHQQQQQAHQQSQQPFAVPLTLPAPNFSTPASYPAPLPSSVSAVPGAAATAAPLLEVVVPAESLFLPPGRQSRPKRVAIVLRGLPGSGKSAAARKLRELELAHGGEAPRVLSLDDYFVTEVDKQVPDDKRKGKIKTIQELEYRYEPEMEGAYMGALLRAFVKTLAERHHAMVILDAPNSRAAEFREFWQAGQTAGYEVYVLRPLETDAEVCFGRNVHGRSRADVEAMAAAWEPVPPLFQQLDASALLSGADRAKSPSGAAADGAAASADAAGDPNGDGGAVPPPMPSDDQPQPPDEAQRGGKGAGVVTGNQGGDDEDAASPPTAKAGSRWAALEDEEEDTGGRGVKRQKVKTDDSAADPAAAAPKLRGILAVGGGSGGARKVRWADGEGTEGAGFSIGRASGQQLETVFVLEGLGPSAEDGEQQPHPSAASFEDQVRSEKRREHDLFRTMLLGHGASAAGGRS